MRIRREHETMQAKKGTRKAVDAEETEETITEDSENGKHRKWTGLLTRKQFDAFVNKLGLYAESTETMGSLGAPGCGFGWSPAISFTGDHEDAIVSAYVTPLPETRKTGVMPLKPARRPERMVVPSFAYAIQAHERHEPIESERLLTRKASIEVRKPSSRWELWA